MSRLYDVIRRKYSILGTSLVLLSSLGGTQIASAGPAVDQLSDCLVKSTTATDKTTVLQWTYAALSVHPDLKAFTLYTTNFTEPLSYQGSAFLKLPKFP